MADEPKHTGHASRIGNLMWAIAGLLGIATGFSLMAWGAFGNLVGGILMAGCLAGWLTIGGYVLLNKTIIDPAGDAIGRIVVSSGSSTPSVAQHSNIEAMEMRGDYARAKDAYIQVIRTQPEDVVACEKLGQLAMLQLKDFDTAIWAFRQAEQRTPEERRRPGYALLALSVIRDKMHDDGRAIVEIRKVLDKYPAIQNADALRAELAELKARHFEGS